MHMAAAFTVPMFRDSDVPPKGCQVGRSSARCRCRRQGAGWSVSK
ncbi:hypothetical protein GZL_01212 [Streptomyces sp. 769]|nr:hypothetical protein GZL_01212 [Streptomyces sp. 769]